MTIFETDRLQVRHLLDADVAELFAVYGDAEAMRWVGDGQPLTLTQCEEWLHVTRRNYATRGYGMSALVERATGRVIGFCGLVHPGGQVQAEIKYALRRDAWGQGFASEAAAGMIGHAASALGLREVIATTAPENLASHGVLGKAGLQRAELRDNDDGSQTQVFRWRAA
jgi:ribosomal-protein-alanine N-acetyltransferase